MKPKHVTKEYLAYLLSNKNNIAISPKADGISTTVNIHKLNKKVCAEYVDNILYVYGFQNSTNTSLLKDMQTIRGAHPFASKLLNNTISSITEFNEHIMYDKTLIDEYIKTTTDRQLWYPKIILRLDLEIEDIASILDTIYDTGYATDGWILTYLKSNDDDKFYTSKYKPIDKMTIDVHIIKSPYIGTTSDNVDIKVDRLDNFDNQNGIYRCYWENDGWVAKDLRYEKKYPNPYHVIEQLTDYHKNPWNGLDIANTIKSVYYDHKSKNLSTITKNLLMYVQNQNRVFIDTIVTNNDINIKRIYDIGCGKGTIATYFLGKEIHGMDIDPINIFHAKSDYGHHSWFVRDCSDIVITMENSLTVFSHSIHNFDPSILDNIKSRYIAIIYINKELIDAKLNSSTQSKYATGNILLYPNLNITIEKLDGLKYKFDYPWTANTIIDTLHDSNCYNKEGYIKTYHKGTASCIESDEIRDFLSLTSFITLQY